MIIGLLGQAGAGKDTTADFLVKNHNFVKVALADPLKRIARDVFDFTDEQLWGPSEKRNAPDMRYPRGMREGDRCLTPRYALQQLGSEWGRNCYPNVWIDYAIRIAKRLTDYPHGPSFYTAREGMRAKYVSDPEVAGVVISDVRFMNEVDAICAAGGRVWKIVRPGAGLQGEAGKHMSETEQEGIDHKHFACIIKNDMSLAVLEQLTKEALELSQK
jgi:hypothetical protein